jgi:N-methylhydantoinase B
MDAITVQILRNKIASLTDEMHYHFYRSGYSTIIRESRDFSCVILDRDGRLIVSTAGLSSRRRCFFTRQYTVI